MKAIGTIYKGVKFRSRLEARWAVFFDEYGLKWEYEPETFEIFIHSLTDRIKCWYCPDFYLPDLKIYVEIKPDKPGEDWKKYGAFRLPIAMVQGLPALNWWWLKYDSDPDIVFPVKNIDGSFIFQRAKWEPDGNFEDSFNKIPAAKIAREYDFFKF